MFTRPEIETKLTAILADITRRPLSEITPDTTMDALGVESLDRIEISIGIETEFNILVNDEEVEDLATVGDIAGFVEKAMKEQLA